MLTRMITDPAVPGANEDAAGALGPVGVLLDGAGVPPRFRAGCTHDVAWYSHRLAARLLGAALEDGLSLTSALHQAIGEVTALHAGSCDLAAGSPSATVVAVRMAGRQLQYLVLCDSSLLLEHDDGTVTRITDTRVEEVAARERTPEAVEAMRNAPGGFWLARHEADAAHEALTGSVPTTGLRAVHLVTDGITRAADLLDLHDEPSLAAELSDDPHRLVGRLRAAESELPPEQRPRKVHDDATVLTFFL